MRPLPRLLRWLLAAVLPASRRDEVSADLERSFEARRERLGEAAARRHLWREAGALVLWRLGRAGGLVAAPGTGEDRGGAGTDRVHAPRRHWTEATTTMGRDVIQDLRFGLRTLARRPGFALTAVVVLGLGIGAPATVLTLASRIFLEPPAHVSGPDRLFRVWRSWAPGEGGGSLQNPDYLYYREGASTVEGLAAWGGELTASWSLDGTRSDQLQAVFVSDNWFDVLGVSPRAGRWFRPAENARPGRNPVVVLNHGFWQRALGADPGAVGRTLTMNGIGFTVVGVAPEGFRGLGRVGEAPDAWVPIAMYGALNRANGTTWWERVPSSRWSWLSVVGRLAPGATFEAAEANFDALSAALEYPERDDAEGVMLTRETLYSPGQATTLRSLFGMLLAVVVMVTAIATANVAVLLLSRATTRSREIGIRTALGAGGGRLFRQLLAESLILGLAGGALGVVLAYAFSDVAASLLPYAFATDFVPDGRVLLAAAALAVTTAVLAGLAPALHAARAGVSEAIGDGRVAGGRSRVRDALVVGQVALSLVLVAGALLFARSARAAGTQDIGFATEGRLVLQVDLQALGYGEEEGRAFIARALERLRGLPGVRGATTSRQIPFQGDWSTDVEPPPGAVPNTADGMLWIGLNAVSSDYFEIMGMPLVRGRPIGADAGLSIVVNETLARHLWPDRDPLGRTVDLDDRQWTVVGVARDATYYELGEEPTTQLWAPVQEVYQPVVHFVVRTDGPATDVADPARAALRELDPELAFGWVSSLAVVFEDVTARYRVSAALVGLFASLALLLAAAGLYGLVSFLVTGRTREIGVRMALGAGRARVAREVVRSGLVLTGTGMAVGLVGALAARRFTEGLLFGVAPEDPWSLVGACVLLLGVTTLASAGPARRATRVDPLEAIRTE